MSAESPVSNGGGFELSICAVAGNAAVEASSVSAARAVRFMEGLSAEGWMAAGLRCAVSAHQPSTRAFPAISCAKPTPCAAPPHGLGLPYGRNDGAFAPPRLEHAALLARSADRRVGK